MELSPAGSYAKETFKDLVLEEVSLKGASFSDSVFSKCRFHRVDFTSANFADDRFDGCEWSLPNLTDAGLHGVTFIGGKLVGVDFTKCNAHFFDVTFKDCLIDTCNFSTLKMKRLSFQGSTIRESRFIGSQLAEADFAGCDLEGTLFHQCDLEGADFSMAKNYSLDPTANRLKGAKFSLPEATSLLTKLGIVLE